MISNDVSFTDASWEPYATSKVWTLQVGDRLKIVYAKFKGTGYDESSTYSDSIILDTAAPTGSILINGAAYSSSSTINLTLSGVAKS